MKPNRTQAGSGRIGIGEALTGPRGHGPAAEFEAEKVHAFTYIDALGGWTQESGLVLINQTNRREQTEQSIA
jgi:hypothetical protein